jgi:mono/diheme cytochrome c family protein
MTTILLAISLLLAGAAQADLHADMEPTPVVKSAPGDPEAANRGSRLFEIYCTSCHGERGRGDGSAAQSMMPPPSDLTRLSRDNDGEFPLARVMLSIDGRRMPPGHREGEMPIWGLSLQEPDSDYYQEETVKKKIEDLTAFLKTLQLPEAD